MRHSPDWTCEECRRRPPAFSKAWSCFRYDSPLKDALHLFKYSRKVALAGPLASLFQTRPIDPQAFDLVMPVPLHPDRLRDREFNQALLLADRLARRSSIPLSYDNLMRTKAAPPQSELSRAARLTNLRRAFAVREPAAIRDARILLIDDVFTTGATAHACAKALRRAGAGPVSVCTLARAV
jgi:ComF family protein